jgi:hypothetical protein
MEQPSKRDRRTEPRTAAEGRVRLYRSDVMGSCVEGFLLDASAHGFRAAHHGHDLTTGQIVAFEHSGASGRARVAWTHITGDHVQSGFYILV